MGFFETCWKNYINYRSRVVIEHADWLRAYLNMVEPSGNGVKMV